MRFWNLVVFVAAEVICLSLAPLRAEYRRAYIDKNIDARFVFVPPGNFTMGSRYAETTAPETEKKFFIDEAPPHQVKISKGFWVMETEVTLRQFRKFVEETGHVTSAERRGESLCD